MSDAEDGGVDFSKVDWDDERRKNLIRSGAAPKVQVVKDLLGSIKSHKGLATVKKQLKVDTKKKKQREQTLKTPLHSQAQKRLGSKVAFKEVRNEVSAWEEIITENRIADQLVYPLNKEDRDVLKFESAVEKSQAFRPKTETERKMAELLGTSKNNLKNDEIYTEAEKEIINAMSVKEAKEKLKELQKQRRLMSFQQEKFARQAKIKSRQYHRIKKRQARKEAIKEFEELLAKDPEAAKEKLLVLQGDRAYERATLRHRGQNKWSKEIRTYASRNVELQKEMADHHRFGRELKQKLGNDLDESSSDSDGSDEDETLAGKKKLTLEEVMKLAADEAAEEAKSKQIESTETNPWLKASLSKLRAEKKAKQNETRLTEAEFAKRGGGSGEIDFEIPEDDPFAAPLEKLVKDAERAELQSQIETAKAKLLEKAKPAPVEATPTPKTKAAKRKAKKAAAEAAATPQTPKAAPEPEVEEAETPVPSKKAKKGKKATASVETSPVTPAADLSKVKLRDVFADVEKTVKEHVTTLAANKKAKRHATETAAEKKAARTAEAKELEAKAKAKKAAAPGVDIDLKSYLEASSATATNMPDNIEACLEEAEQQDMETDNMLAEAFAGDDVFQEFEDEKQRVEDDENPITEDVDVHSMGWGSWTGPGIAEKKKKKTIVKTKPHRKDGKTAHVIIRENVDQPITKLQPESVPFPYTRATEFEAVLQQPIGRDWNPTTYTAALTKPEIVAPAGRIIRPLSKETLRKRQNKAVSSDEED
uniref:U3 small nucleolar RNA-associated protein 14 homolog A n=1 Tax=Panagrellus redivivus TaxID=6233 RepID=A0A7E4VVJ3_PANRE